jgi:hypothetical protein
MIRVQGFTLLRSMGFGAAREVKGYNDASQDARKLKC